MFDIVASIKKLNLDLSGVGKSITDIYAAIDSLNSGDNYNQAFTGTVTLASTSGVFSLEQGTGNGASYTTYNSLVRLPTGLGILGPDGATKGFFDGAHGILDMKGGLRVNGSSVLTALDFHPTDYATISGASFTGPVAAPAINTPGVITAATGTFSGRVSATDGTLSGRLTALNATVSGSTALNTLTLTGALSGTSAALSGAITASAFTAAGAISGASAAITNGITAKTAVLSDGIAAATGSFGNLNGTLGGLNLQTGGTAQSGYIEFTQPGNARARYGYIGFSSAAGVINLSAETAGGYINLITINGAVDPKVNGNTIWHAGNLNPSSFGFDGSGYMLKASPVISADFNASGFRITNALSLGTTSGTGSALLSSDTNVNNFKIRTGPSNNYATTYFQADGSVSVPGTLNAAGGLNVTGSITTNNALIVNGIGTFKADVVTHRNNSSGFLFLGNTNSRYIGYDGSNYVMPGGQLFVNGSQVWHAGNFNPYGYVAWGSGRSWSDGNGQALTIAPKSSGMSTADGFIAGFSIQSPDYSGGAFMQFLNQNRYGVYFGLDVDNQLRVGGWSMGAASYRIHHQGNCNPVIDIRMVDAGSLTYTWNINANDSAEPYNGGVMTSIVFQGDPNNVDSRRVGGARWRYVQKQDSYGNWSTVGYA